MPTGSTSGSASVSAPISENDLAISRQAHEMQVVLKTITMLNSNCKEEHREYVWARSLHFLLNVGDLLLAGQSMPGKCFHFGKNTFIHSFWWMIAC